MAKAQSTTGKAPALVGHVLNEKPAPGEIRSLAVSGQDWKNGA